MAPRGDAYIISVTYAHRHVAVPPRGAIFWRMANFEFAILAPPGAGWRRVAPIYGKRVMTLSDQFLAPNFDFLAPKTIIGAKYYRQ